MGYFADYRDHVGSQQDRHYKTTLFSGAHLMIGMNCLEPGQTQPVHDHQDADKVYFVLEGTGTFRVGAETRQAGPGTVVWAPAGMVHGVENRDRVRLVLLVGIAPPPQDRQK